MPDPVPGPRPIPNKGSAEDRLQSWKEIAAYLGRDVRSVYRWEKNEHLPIHRLKHGKHGSVHAYKSELDAWVARRTASPCPSDRRPGWVPWAAVGMGLATLAVWAGILARQSTAPRAASVESAVALPFSSSPGIEIQPRLSPDGNTVAFAWNGGEGNNLDIYVKSAAGGAPLRVTADPAEDYSPAWSPDGASIAFLRRRDAERVAVMVAPASGRSERVVIELATGARIDWSRPGPFLAWSHNADAIIMGGHLKPNSPDQLLRISAASGEAVPITDPPAGIYGDAAPALSPDGKILAFIRRISWGTADLCILPVTEGLRPAGKPRRVDTGSPWNASPAWMPDGQSLVFSKGSMDAPHLARVPAAFGGGAAVRLSGFGEHGWQPTVASTREGKVRIAFVQHFESVNIWRLPLDGSGAASELIASAHRNYEPDYSPDGGRIAFLSDRSGYAEVWVAKSDGSDPQQWTFLKQPSLGAPRWSPDGRRIAFTAPGPQGSSVYWTDTPGAAPRIVPDSYPSGYFAWAPDGRSIYFTSNRTGNTNIWKVAPEGNARSQMITHRSARVPYVSADGRHLFFLRLVSPDGANDLFRASHTGNDEKRVLSFADAYSVCRAGIAYKYYRPGRNPEGPDIRFYSYTTGRTARVAETPKPLRYGIAASPDCRYLLYSQTDFDVSDLMLVDDFK